MQSTEQIQRVSISKIKPNPFQPRRHFDQKRLEELAESIRANDLAQPIVVRPDGPDGIILVLGERRLRAFKLNGEDTIPAIVRNLTPEQAQEITLIENLQREDLTIIEEAQSLRDLVEANDGNVSEVARKVGKYPKYVADRIRLLELPDDVQKMLDNGLINATHAEVLWELEDPDQQCKAAAFVQRFNFNANQLRGMMQRHLGGKKTRQNNNSSGAVRFAQVSKSVVHLFEMVQDFDFGMLQDENKRTTLKKQIELLQRSLAETMDQLVGKPREDRFDGEREEEEEADADHMAEE